MNNLINMMRNFIFIFLFLNVFCELFSQQIIVYNTSNSSIASNNVKTVYVDEFGAIWFGTANGLCRFYSNQWKTYTTTDNIGQPPINAIIGNTKNTGEMIIGTSNGGSIAVYNNQGVTSANNYNKSSYPFLSDNIVDVTVDSYGTRYFATNKGITWNRGDKWDTITCNNFKSSIPKDPILCIYVSNDTLFVGSQGYEMAKGGIGRALLSLDGITGASIIQGPYNGNLNNAVHSVFIDNQRFQWYGTEGGVFKHYGWELKNLDFYTYYSRNEGLAGDTVYSINQDQYGRIWLGTSGGISIVHSYGLRNLTHKNGLPSDTIYDIAFDNNKAWIATPKGAASIQSDIFVDVNNKEQINYDKKIIKAHYSNNLLNIEFDCPSSQMVNIYLCSIDGKILSTLKYNASKGLNTLSINCSKYYLTKAALYNVMIFSDGYFNSAKFIIN